MLVTGLFLQQFREPSDTPSHFICGEEYEIVLIKKAEGVVQSAKRQESVGFQFV